MMAATKGERMATARSAPINTSTRKAVPILSHISGQPVSKALAQLTYMPQKVAGEVQKVLCSAIANAENNHQMDIDRLSIYRAFTNLAYTLKRSSARAKGRSSRISKPFLRIIIELVEKPIEISVKK